MRDWDIHENVLETIIMSKCNEYLKNVWIVPSSFPFILLISLDKVGKHKSEMQIWIPSFQTKAVE